MAKLTILEGARCGGKTGLAVYLRQMVFGTTLINFTGFSEDGEEGRRKSHYYYWAFIEMFKELPADVHIVCDRIFLSEVVYSRLYKDYKFSFESMLFNLAQHNDIDIFFLTVDEEHIGQRLNREKAALFDKVDDGVSEIIKQQNEYAKVFDEVRDYLDRKGLAAKVRILPVDTSGKTLDDVREEVLRQLHQQKH